MMIKLDLEKAYDKLSWSFIHETLIFFGLPHNQIQLIMTCITTVTFRLLWNGEPTESFTPGRGIHQGDPLSPYIFVLCLERLSHLINCKVEPEVWKPIALSHRGPYISHLFFADDVILFAKAEMSQATVIYDYLSWFCNSAGQKVSFTKLIVLFSTMFPLLLQVP